MFKKMGGFAVTALLVALTVVGVAGAVLVPDVAHAAIPALDVSTASSYLEDNAGGNMQEIGLVVFGLAALGMAITWVKATFFS